MAFDPLDLAGAVDKLNTDTVPQITKAIADAITQIRAELAETRTFITAERKALVDGVQAVVAGIFKQVNISIGGE